MSSPSIAADASARVGVQRLFWRVHFWAGLVTAPIVLFAACTGLLYVLTPQIEARAHAGVDRVPAAGATLPLDAPWEAAQRAAPGWTTRYIVPAHQPGETKQVLFAAPLPHSGHAVNARAGHDHGLPTGRIVYVDPHIAQVVYSLAEMDRFKAWSKKLHSSALQGNGWRWLIELAASWMLVMIATGITVGWPRSRAAQQALAQASPRLPTELRSQAGPRASLQTLFDTARAEMDAAGGPALPLQMVPPKGSDGVWRIVVMSSQVRAVPVWIWALALVLAFAMPVFGISAAVLVTLELLAAAWGRLRPSSSMA